MAGESGSRVSWLGLLRWSLSHIDGTHFSPHISEEKRSWFEEAMEAQATVGMAQRMRDMTLLLLTSPSHLEDLLDELHEHVESIDIANGVAGWLIEDSSNYMSNSEIYKKNEHVFNFS